MQGIQYSILFLLELIVKLHNRGPGTAPLQFFDYIDAEDVPHIVHEEQEVDIPMQMDQEQHELEMDYIKVVHHPNADIAEQIFRFDDYCGPESFRTDESIDGKYYGSLDDLERPWRPFRTKLNFEVADVMLDTHMNTQQTEQIWPSFTRQSSIRILSPLPMPKTFRMFGTLHAKRALIR
jgi:hypothetical protein